VIVTAPEIVGAYLRVSDDAQEIATQRKTINDYSQRTGEKIDPRYHYEDEGWSRDETDRRPDWLRMLADVDAGKLTKLVVAAKDRFGTASGRRKVLFYARLWDAGCKLVLATTGEVLNAPNLLSDMTALVDGEGEQTELRSKSERALEKMRQHHEAGRWMGGSIPFGLDVVCMNGQGIEQWRVYLDGPDMRVKISPNGDRQRYDGKNNFPARDHGQFLTLRPTHDQSRLELVREVFAWFDTEALSTYQTAARLNDAGQPHNAGSWRHWHIERMLRNRAYLGLPTWNQTSRAKWSEHIGGKTLPHAERNTKGKKHAREDWITPDEQFEPIIDPPRFDRVQAKLGQRPTAPRAPKTSAGWLSGLLYCQCGQQLVSTSPNGVTKYICSSYLDRCNGDKETCPYRDVKHTEAEQWVREYLGEIGSLLPSRHKGPPAKIAGKLQTAWVDAMHRIAAAQQDMNARVAEWARNADEKTVTKFSRRPTMLATDESGRPVYGADGQLVEFEGEPRVVVKDAYRAIFAGERERDQSRLDQIETEHSNLSLAWQTLPTQRAKDKVAARLLELEEEISDLERRVTDAAGIHDKATAELSTLLDEWNAATEAIDGEMSNRSKAAAVRKVIARMNVTFAPTGRTRPSWYVSEVEIVPVGADGNGETADRHPKIGGGDGEVRDVSSSGPRRTAKRAAIRGCGCGTARSRSGRPSGIGGWNSCVTRCLRQASNRRLLRRFGRIS
jgi:DNA invertase Pin-like site-specific DNA recombinase